MTMKRIPDAMRVKPGECVVALEDLPTCCDGDENGTCCPLTPEVEA